MDWIHTESVYYAEVKPIFAVAKATLQTLQLCNFAKCKKNTRPHLCGVYFFVYDISKM